MLLLLAVVALRTSRLRIRYLLLSGSVLLFAIRFLRKPKKLQSQSPEECCGRWGAAARTISECGEYEEAACKLLDFPVEQALLGYSASPENYALKADGGYGYIQNLREVFQLPNTITKPTYLQHVLGETGAVVARVKTFLRQSPPRFECVTGALEKFRQSLQIVDEQNAAHCEQLQDVVELIEAMVLFRLDQVAALRNGQMNKTTAAVREHVTNTSRPAVKSGIFVKSDDPDDAEAASPVNGSNLDPSIKLLPVEAVLRRNNVTVANDYSAVYKGYKAIDKKIDEALKEFSQIEVMASSLDYGPTLWHQKRALLTDKDMVTTACTSTPEERDTLKLIARYLNEVADERARLLCAPYIWPPCEHYVKNKKIYKLVTKQQDEDIHKAHEVAVELSRHGSDCILEVLKHWD